MKNGFVDIHTHPFRSIFENQEEEILLCKKNGVELQFFTTTCRKEFKEVIETTKKMNFVKGVFGIHPDSSLGREDGKFLQKNICSKAVAIGEIGLDFFRETNPPREIQIESFKSQIEIAKKLELPVIIHCRNAFDELWEIVSSPNYSKINFVFHTFSEDWENAKKVLEKPNFWLSFSGTVTFQNAKKIQEVAKNTPLNRIFAETDTPYLTPHPFRGKRNSSRNVILIYEKIASLKNVQLNEVINTIRENVRNVFKV